MFRSILSVLRLRLLPEGDAERGEKPMRKYTSDKSMDSFEYIRHKVMRLYETEPCIHISIKTSHSRTARQEIPAVIKGVYKSIFQIEECDVKHPTRITVQYNDLLTGQVVIKELDFIPDTNKL